MVYFLNFNLKPIQDIFTPSNQTLVSIFISQRQIIIVFASIRTKYSSRIYNSLLTLKDILQQ